ncbi:single-stranded-DNA-specific exonuclease RecJ [Paenibacillus alkalitolerans]|uniref:single-stranded-DNA-specific exonuclease RecJ n=1 Tax=Paenibacillus alkalitolerans TaxID=2799335 RepID=UPI0018F5951F|nr:single-stranded-DNA-specific exonuclease RecJ [Paenibacillus alkalitolerans]
MLSSKARWKIGSPDPAGARALQDRLNIRPLLAALLAARGIGAEEAEILLSAKLEFHDPMLLDGMAVAAERIERAVRDEQYIRIYGDYDADGVSSTSLMVRLMRMLGARFDYYIPHRVTEGYGLHVHAIEQAHSEGVGLLVTVDTGISAAEQVDKATELGLDVIVTDHHEPPEVLPNAVAVINPKKSACPYPFKGLAGVGVAFKLAQALLRRVPEELAEYAALGTIADLMPLTGENRCIVKLGLERMRDSPYAGFRALFRVAGISGKEVTAGQIGFSVAPRVNAVGRLDSADEAVRLLVTDKEDEAETLALRLDALNGERQSIVEQTAAEAFEQVEKFPEPSDTIVVSSSGWNPGVIGIVASKLVERYFKPSIVIAVDEETGLGKGSARAVPGFHLFEALQHCADCLEHFGGHESAAGLTVRIDRLEQFVRRLNEYAERTITPEMKLPSLAADSELSLGDITVENIEELDKLAPYGMQHTTPRFVLRGAVAGSASVLGKDRKHLKIALRGDRTGAEVNAVCFGMGGLAPFISSGARVDLLGELSVNEWKGRKSAQLIVKDLRIPHRQLFDWRGAVTSKAMNDNFLQWGIAQRNAAILVSERDGVPPLFEPWAESMPVHKFQYDGKCEPANAGAARNPTFENVTDMIVACCPFPLHSFRHILEQCASLERIYAAFGERNTGANRLCDRSSLGVMYSAVKEACPAPHNALVETVSRLTGFDIGQAGFALQVFRELQLLEEEAGEGIIRCPPSPRKRDLRESPTYRMEEEAERARRYWAGCPVETLTRRLLAPLDLLEDQEAEQITEAIL